MDMGVSGIAEPRLLNRGSVRPVVTFSGETYGLSRFDYVLHGLPLVASGRLAGHRVDDNV